MSDVWKYYKKDGNDHGICNECFSKLKTKGGSTKGLWTHLKTTHPDVLKNSQATSTKRKNYSDLEPTKKLKSSHSIDSYFYKETLGEILAKFAAKDGFSIHAILNSEGIREYIRLKKMEMPNSLSTVASLIYEFYEHKKGETIQKLKKRLEIGGKYSISIDEWSDCQQRKYLNITLHDPEEDIVLGLKLVEGSCNAERTTELVTEFLDEFKLDLENDIVASSNDGAAVMVKYGKLNKNISQVCYNHAIHNSVVKVFYENKSTQVDSKSGQEIGVVEDEDDTEYEESKGRDAFFNDLDSEPDYTEIQSISEVLNQTRKIVKFFKYSSVRKSIFQKHVLEQEGKNLNLILDCKTRWKSTDQMVARFIKLEKPINDTLIEIGREILPKEHFSILTVISQILAPAAEVINELSKNNSNLLTSEGSIAYLFETLNENPHPLAAELVSELKDKLLARRNKKVVSLLYFLHNGTYAKRNKFLEYSSKEEVKSFAEQLHQKFSLNNKEKETSSSGSGSEDEAQPDKIMQRENKLQESINKVLNAKKVLNKVSIKNEMSQYECSGAKSANLEKLYESLLTIKSTSTASERIFSISGFICSKIRNRMSTRMLNALVFLRYYFLKKIER